MIFNLLDNLCFTCIQLTTSAPNLPAAPTAPQPLSMGVLVALSENLGFYLAFYSKFHFTIRDVAVARHIKVDSDLLHSGLYPLTILGVAGDIQASCLSNLIPKIVNPVFTFNLISVLNNL